MYASVELVKADLLQQLEHVAEQRLEPARVAGTLDFIRTLYEHVPPADFIKDRADHLYAVAVSLLGFMDSRRPGEVEIRIYDPRLDEHGWHSPHTVIEILNDDMPFLVDSLLAELNRQGTEVQLLVHPIFAVTRDRKGKLTEFSNGRTHAKGKQTLESLMHVRVRAQPRASFAAMEAQVRSVFADVRASVEDFQAMLLRVRELIDTFEKASHLDPAERDEAVAFLTWLSDNQFIYQGYRHCTFVDSDSDLLPKCISAAGLGILRDPEREVFEGFQPPDGTELVRIFKANRRSTVNRAVHLDVIVVPDPMQREDLPRSVSMFVGLFTLSAYSRSASHIPLLRRKLAHALERSGLLPSSHDGKTLRYILETYPRDELFQVPTATLLSIATGILHLQGRQRVAFFARPDPFHRFVSCLVYLPRDRFDTNLRLKVQKILGHAFNGSVTAYYTYLGDESLARLHLIIKTPGGTAATVDHLALERKLHEATRSWRDRLETALVSELGEEPGIARARRYGDAFPGSYAEHFDELTAVADIEFVEQALATNHVTLHLYHQVEARDYELGLKVFSHDGFLSLSDILPTLENMGLRVSREVPYEVRPAGEARKAWIHDFALVTEGQVPVKLSEVRDSFVETLQGVLGGQLENDGFNKLVLHAGLRPRQANLLRAYAKYLRQTRVPFSLDYIQNTLKTNAGIAGLLVELFEARHAPSEATLEQRPEVQARFERIRARILTELDQVQNLDDDRILRRLLTLIEATLRTNFFQLSQQGLKQEFKTYLSFKLDASAIPWLPQPRPYREVFVFSPRLEGVHLRFGAVARGGVRWSDRREDFRTEILGLVKAQLVKNAVIVPVGSKGGFVLKQPPAVSLGREALLEEGIACYQTFIKGLLDLTDNRQGDAIIAPRGVVCLDAPDPYLVVAADKGTATFSDIANGISNAYGFWLDDAFASGGSAGYDHKKMGITARGAWESVKRHFRELGKDIQSETFSCAAVGDMSGDVFGNALLLSKHTLLIAAFNHLHIFVDPNPDPELSWQERQRLFKLPRSNWSDYDRSKLSEGGAVFERGAKSVMLSQSARWVLGIEAETLTPSELISAILLAPVELLFLGGIGTYVKAHYESHVEVGDRTNDGVRVDARNLKAKVVGEGANLGFTQCARMEFALNGGKCNTDFIDNSGGVDCSDHEVNIKILLGEVERAGDITRKQRNELLVQMTAQVAELVLRDNYLQTQTLSTTERIGLRLTDRLGRFMRGLERSGRLNRELQYLPTEDQLEERHKTGVGLVRPELCVLLSYAKLDLYAELLASELPDEPSLERDLVRYFPDPIRERFPDAIARHRLRRELIATVVTNDLVNRLGITFAYEASEATGMSAAQIAMAYIAAREIHRMWSLWREIEALDNRVSAELQSDALLACGRLLTSTSIWLLRTYALDLNIPIQIDTFQAGAQRLMQQLAWLLPEQDQALLKERTEGLVQAGIPQNLASQVASLGYLSASCDIVQVSHDTDRSVDDVARLYFQVGQRFGFEWLRRLARALPSERSWDKQAVTAVIDDLFVSQRALVTTMLAQTQRTSDPDSLIENWMGPKRPLVARSQQLLTELQSTASPDFAMLAVADRQLKALLAGR